VVSPSWVGMCTASTLAKNKCLVKTL